MSGEAGAPGTRPSAAQRRPAVLAVVDDEPTRALLARILVSDRLILVSDPVHALEVARSERPDVVLVDITLGNGAGLATLKPMKATAPDAHVYAMTTGPALAAGAHAAALAGAGLLMMPLAGDEILSAVGMAKDRIAEAALRNEIEQQASMSARAAEWIARAAELAPVSTCTEAAERLAEVLIEATGATGAAVYLTGADRELLRYAATPGLERPPPAGTEEEILRYARREHFHDIRLSTGRVTVGHVLLMNPEDVGNAGRPSSSGADAVTVSSAPPSGSRDRLLNTLITQASTAISLHRERERLHGMSTIGDPTSSAYSFAFYADMAGREIYRAARYGRRVSFIVFLLQPHASGVAGAPETSSIHPAVAADYMLRVASEMAILGRVDQRELHLVLPECNGVAAHVCRRRVLAQLAAVGREIAGAPSPHVLAGIATLPHDGQDLDHLVRVAQRRAETSRVSILHRLPGSCRGIADLLDALMQEAAIGSTRFDGPRSIELSLEDAATLAGSVVEDALRGGAIHVLVTYHPDPNLFSTVRAAVGGSRSGISFRAVDLRKTPACADIEALCVESEHGTYALIGRVEGRALRGAHASDPLIVDALLERIGAASGGPIFG